MDERKILVVDDDPNICRLLELYLQPEGFTLFFRHDGSSALDALKSEPVDLVLLDVMLPVMNGWDTLRLIREQSGVPVIMLTARDMLDDKVLGFELGAHDYIVKPFEPRELVARLKARLREAEGAVRKKDKTIRHGSLTIDMDRFEASVSGVTLEMKPKEIQLLYFLLLNKTRVFTREQLLDKVWEYTYSGDTRTVDMHVKRVREKLNAAGAPVKISTVWGVGYKLEAL